MELYVRAGLYKRMDLSLKGSFRTYSVLYRYQLLGMEGRFPLALSVLLGTKIFSCPGTDRGWGSVSGFNLSYHFSETLIFYLTPKGHYMSLGSDVLFFLHIVAGLKFD